MNGLAADGVTVTLGGRAVLDGVSARFVAGRVTALLGPNGAGKSTLLACLAGLRRPAAGRAALDGADVTTIEPRARARAIGYLPQGHEVHWNLVAEEVVALGRLPHGDSDRRAVRAAMAAADVAHLAARPILDLSGGERARVLIARVLAGQPHWLLADEPLADLDPAHRLALLALLRRQAAAGLGVVMVLHDLTLAARFADDALLLAEGRVLAAGPVGEVLTPANIARGYGVEAHVGRLPGGEAVVSPLRLL